MSKSFLTTYPFLAMCIDSSQLARIALMVFSMMLICGLKLESTSESIEFANERKTASINRALYSYIFYNFRIIFKQKNKKSNLGQIIDL